VMVVLAAALAQGLTGRRLAKLREELGADRRTLERWRRWWCESVPRTAFWIALRGRFDSPLVEGELPASLLERVGGGDAEEGLLRFLRLIEPLSRSTLMEGRSSRAA
ncbi:MAG: hypothetical protein AB1467_07555, partial [Candidatus Diapherotrites archaeon]